MTKWPDLQKNQCVWVKIIRFLFLFWRIGLWGYLVGLWDTYWAIPLGRFQVLQMLLHSVQCVMLVLKFVNLLQWLYFHALAGHSLLGHQSICSRNVYVYINGVCVSGSQASMSLRNNFERMIHGIQRIITSTMEYMDTVECIVEYPQVRATDELMSEETRENKETKTNIILKRSEDFVSRICFLLTL